MESTVLGAEGLGRSPRRFQIVLHTEALRSYRRLPAPGSPRARPLARRRLPPVRPLAEAARGGVPASNGGSQSAIATDSSVTTAAPATAAPTARPDIRGKAVSNLLRPQTGIATQRRPIVIWRASGFPAAPARSSQTQPSSGPFSEFPAATALPPEAQP